VVTTSFGFAMLMQHFLQTIPNYDNQAQAPSFQKKCSIYIPPRFDQLEAESGGGLLFFLVITPNLGEMIQFDKHFSDGLVQPPPSETMMVAKFGLGFQVRSIYHSNFGISST